MARENDLFKFKRFLKKDEGALPAQAELILKTIHDAGEITRTNLLKKLETTLTTKQAPARVLSFYPCPLVNSGCIQVISDKVAPKARPQKRVAAKS
jgi:hypothetical protein